MQDINISTNELLTGSIQLEGFPHNETAVLASQPHQMVTPSIGSVVIPTNSGPQDTLSRAASSSKYSTTAVSRWTIWKQRSFLVFSTSLLTFILSVILVPPAFKAIQIGEEGLKLAHWTALKDFRENCKDLSAMKLELSRACVDALAIPLPKPPFFEESFSAKVSKRLMDTPISTTRRMTSRIPWVIYKAKSAWKFCKTPLLILVGLLLGFISIISILSHLTEMVAIRVPLDEGEDCLGDNPLEETINRQLRVNAEERGTGLQIRSRIKLTTRLRRPWPYGKDEMGVKIVGAHKTAHGTAHTLGFSGCWLCANEKPRTCNRHVGLDKIQD